MYGRDDIYGYHGNDFDGLGDKVADAMTMGISGARGLIEDDYVGGHEPTDNIIASELSYGGRMRAHRGGGARRGPRRGPRRNQGPRRHPGNRGRPPVGSPQWKHKQARLAALEAQETQEDEEFELEYGALTSSSLAQVMRYGGEHEEDEEEDVAEEEDFLESLQIPRAAKFVVRAAAASPFVQGPALAVRATARAGGAMHNILKGFRQGGGQAPSAAAGPGYQAPAEPAYGFVPAGPVLDIEMAYGKRAATNRDTRRGTGDTRVFDRRRTDRRIVRNR